MSVPFLIVHLFQSLQHGKICVQVINHEMNFRDVSKQFEIPLHVASVSLPVFLSHFTKGHYRLSTLILISLNCDVVKISTTFLVELS